MTPTSRRPIDYYLLWLVAIVSLILNVVVINALLAARRSVGDAAAVAADGVSQLRSSAIDYNVEIHQMLPVSITIDYAKDFVVPISVTLPIDTHVTVPLSTPLGDFPIDFPVSTTVPIRLSPIVPLSISVPVSTTIPVDVAFPIHVALKDTALGTSLADVEIYLRDAAVNLGKPPTASTNLAPTKTPPKPE